MVAAARSRARSSNGSTPAFWRGRWTACRLAWCWSPAERQDDHHAHGGEHAGIVGIEGIHELTGSNFTRGVVSSLLSEVSLSGKLDTDIAVLELDEAYAVHFVRQVQPDYCLLLNVMRDQLDRFGRNRQHRTIVESKAAKRPPEPSTSIARIRASMALCGRRACRRRCGSALFRS